MPFTSLSWKSSAAHLSKLRGHFYLDLLALLSKLEMLNEHVHILDEILCTSAC